MNQNTQNNPPDDEDLADQDARALKRLAGRVLVRDERGRRVEIKAELRRYDL